MTFSVAQPAAAAASGTFLLGDKNVESSPDTNGSGITQAFSYTAVASGVPTDVEVYVGSNAASALRAGIYSDSSGTPSRLLASGTLSAVTANDWNDVQLGGSPPSLTSGTRYWISIGGTGGSGLLYFRDVPSGGTASYAAKGLPSKWTSAGGPWPVGPASAYVNGATSGTPAPVNTALPAIGGATVQGSVLTTTHGSWTNSPTAFAYQWQDCDSSGADCTSISGAASNTYTLGSGDVGHTIRVVVTASNSAGHGAATSAQTAAVTAASASGTITHVVWILMENHGYGSIIGSSQAPYINHLANTYGLATNYFGLAHPSLPNYIGLTSGSTQGISDDNDPSSHPLNVPSIFSQLPGGKSRSLLESMPSNCYASDSGEYLVRHNPMAYYTNLGPDCSNFDVPLGSTPDLSAAFTLITPNAIDDMHDGTIAQGDSFLSSFVPALTATSQYQAGNTAIFITWDEDENSGGNNQVATIVVSPYTNAIKVSTAFNHYSLLRTAEDLLGLPALGNAASASPMESAFGLTGSPPPPPSPPANTALPAISGTAQQGQTLTAANGSWTNSPTAYAYQWEDCDSSGANCASISGATSSSYGLGSGDVGHTIRVVVTASNAGGQGVATSTQTATVTATAATPPSNTALPAISGTAQAGQTLTTSNGTWTGTPPLSYAYQWQRCSSSGSCQNVGTNASTYSLTASDVGSTIRATVTASNAGGSSSATSPASAVVAAAHDPVVVAVGDIACAPGDTGNNCEQTLTANLASAQHPDAVLPLGDNQYNSGLLSEYTGAGAYGATWGIFNPIAYPTTGNHEYAASSSAAGYFSYFGAALHGSTATAPYYSYNLGTWHIVSLDSSCNDSGCGDVVTGETSSAQTSWLQSDLAAHPAACTLAYWHHPRFSGSWTNDSPGTGPLFSALYDAHADIVVSGHDHVYERYAQQDPTGAATTTGVRQFVAGTGGESLFTMLTNPPNLQVSDQNDFGVLVLTLHASSYDWAFKRLDGTVVDSGTTACHGSGTGPLAAREARDARAWPVGPTGPALRFDARLYPSTVATSSRGGLPVLIHLTRAADVTIAVSLRRGRHLSRIASFYETETQIPRPHSRIVLRLPPGPLKGTGPVMLVVRFAAVDGAGHHRTVTRTAVLKRS
ncbi:MAG: metallophosphoesterase [Solirubrobacterales bacterium]|nr:metallophosphoesterase [Solirubrobacterales bacterium]